MDGTITIGTKLDTKSFDKQIEALENKLRDLEKQKIYFETNNMQGEFEDVEIEIEKTKNKLVQLNAQKEKLNDTKAIDNLGKSFEKSVKNVGRLVLGIFGVRTAYMALRRASSDLDTYDEQYATNLEYIRFVLTQAIAPVLRGIVSLAMKLLQLINMIVNALFGVNLFSKGSAESFNKMKKGASGVSKAVKEIKKQLAGFDDVNILTNQSDTGTSGGAGGVGIPDMDLSKLQGEPPEWIKWIAENKDLIFAVLAGIASGILAIKLGLDGIKALGIGVLVAGIIYTVQNLIKYLKDPSWENFGKIIQGVGVAIVGLGILIGSVPVAVAGAIVLIVGTIVKYWEQIKAFFQNGINWLKSMSDFIRKTFGDTIGDIFDSFVRAFQHILNFFDSIFTAIKGILDGIILLITGLFTGNWQKAWQGVKEIFTSLWNGIIGILKNGIGAILELLVAVGKTAGLIISSAFKGVVNSILWAIEGILNTPIKAINGLIDTINQVPGINLGKLSTFKLPRLAVGGIVNIPNKGVMLGGAIAGESGAEGVIPLTDTQAMETLGEAIGRYITINANIVNKMNGRVISRELQTIKNDNEFAYNL